MRPLCLVVPSLLLCLPSVAACQLIDFETLPDGTPVTDDMLIRDQYNTAPYWVSFELVGQPPNVGPRIARVGPPMTAFEGPGVYSECSDETSMLDKPALDEPVGCFFLTDDGAVIDQAFTLLVSYTFSVQQASGMLLDIDGQEEWTVTALAQDGTSVIDTRVLAAGDPGSGDGVASSWSFDPRQDIYFVKIEYTGVGDGVGLAFDNFSPSALAAVNLHVEKDGPLGPMVLGTDVVYDLTVTNAGPSDAADVVLEDVLPPGVTFAEAIPSQGACVFADGRVTCELGLIAVAAGATVQIVGVLDQAFVVNSATVSSLGFELEPADNFASAITEVDCASTAVPEGAPSVVRSRLEQNAPNPFNPRTSIEFTLEDAGIAEVVVFDTAGRLVRRLLSTHLEAGKREVIWDGRDDNGRMVASGAYFYQLSLAGRTLGMRKAIVLK